MLKSFLDKISRELSQNKATRGDVLIDRNVSIVRLSAVLVLGISLYWTIVDKISDSYSLNVATKIGVYCQILVSVYMIIFPAAVKRMKKVYIRISFLIYYIVIFMGVAVITLSRNLQIISSGADYSNLGISVSAFYLFIFSFMPLPDVLDSIIVIIGIFAGLMTPELIARTSAYSMFGNFLLSCCFTLIYIFFRNIMLESAEQVLEISGLNDDLTEYSFSDPLTTVLNRRALDEYLSYLEQNSVTKQIGVIFLDIDYFKEYNDCYGHLAGDNALRRVAISLQNVLKDIDGAFVFRYGGEEFIAVLDDTDEKQLIAVMKKLRQAIADENIERDDKTGCEKITVTIGGSIENLSKTDKDHIKEADNQLYIGKRTMRDGIYLDGVNIVDDSFVFEISNKDEALDISATLEIPLNQANAQQRKIIVESRFGDAVQNKEFVVWYQPKFSSVTQLITGAEALVRWAQPDGSIISPFFFMNILEEDGLIAVLDEYVFENVCSTLRDLKDRGIALTPVSVNLSRASLLKDGTIERYCRIIDSYGIDKKYVPIEITESAAIDNADIKDSINEIREAGFKLHLDDFGTGYSSLSSLCTLPIDTVKLDMSLIRNIGNPSGDEILKHVVEMSHFLGMEVVAEGVDSADQLNFLRKLDCDTIQGYLLSKPVVYSDFERLYIENIQDALKLGMVTEEDENLGHLRLTSDVKMQYLQAMCSVYMTIHVIDLVDDTVMEFATTTNVKAQVHKAHGAAPQMRGAMCATVAPEALNEALEFTDVSTIKERLKGKRSMSREFAGVHFAKFRAQFIVISVDKNENPTKIAFTTQVVQTSSNETPGNKQKNFGRIDELTGVNTKEAFDDDMAAYEQALKSRNRAPENFALIYMDINELKSINDTRGRAAGDELICGAADILNNAVDKFGIVYRVGGDEFIAVLKAKTEKLSEIEKLIDAGISNWMGDHVRKLEATYVSVSSEQYPGLEVSSLIQISEMKMEELKKK